MVCAVCVLCAFMGVGSARAQPGAGDDRAALIEEMARVVQAGQSRGALDETAIVGLRTLKDDRLAPLFAALADAALWEARVHGVLGLAEVDPSHRVNTLVVSEIKDPQVRAVVVGEALKQDLVEPADLRELIEIRDLEPTLRLVLLAKLRGMDGEVSADEIDAVVAEIPAESVGMRVYGSLLAADVRGEDGAAVWSIVEEVKMESSREAILSVVLRQVREQPMKLVTGFVDNAWSWGKGRSLLDLDVVGALMAQMPELGAVAWTELWGSATDLSRRIMLGTLLVEFSPVLPPGIFESLSKDPDPCVQKLGAFGGAVAGGGEFGDALYALLAQDHRLSTSAALQALGQVTPERRAAASARVLEQVLAREQKSSAPRYGFEAARVLARDDVPALLVLIERAAADRDAPVAQMLLTAVLEKDPMRPWAAGVIPEMPDRRSRVLASLVEARASLGAGLTDQQIEDLRRIAAGRELLPPAMRVQAAWLALCALGQEREALALVLAPEAPARPVAPPGD